MANKRLDQLAREFIGRKIAGESSQMTLAQMKRQYYVEYLGTSSKVETIPELELRWLRKFIADNGGTPAGDYADLWKQAVIEINQTPKIRTTENMQLFYLFAP